jgi:phosphate:Na+ symporter
MRSSVETRQVPLGNLFFKILGVLIMAPLVGPWLRYVRPYVPDDATLVVLFHLAFNAVMALVCIGFTQPIAGLVERLMPREQANPTDTRPRHLDSSALATPSLAISCAAREALHQADVVETMLQGIHTVIRTADLKLSQDLRKLDDTVDSLYSDIKYYMTKISREALDEKEGRRWTDIMGFTINMEQVGDIIERVLIDIEDKKIKRGLKFSEAGMEEINDLHARLIDNLRLAMSVFLNDNVRDAKRLLEEKTRFRELERDYAAAHLVRLQDRSVASMETSSLHIDLISDFKRINSLLCSVAYPILEQNNALAPSRLRSSSGSKTA